MGNFTRISREICRNNAPTARRTTARPAARKDIYTSNTALRFIQVQEGYYGRWKKRQAR